MINRFKFKVKFKILIMVMASVQEAEVLNKALKKLGDSFLVAAVELQQLIKSLHENGVDKTFQKKPRFIKRFSAN